MNFLELAVKEAVDCKRKIEQEKQKIKDLRKKALEMAGVKPEIFNQYVSLSFSNDYVRRTDKTEQIRELIDDVIGSTQMCEYKIKI